MNPPETPAESFRVLQSKGEVPPSHVEGVPVRASELPPRYIEVPVRVDSGIRNLVWGVVLLSLAVALIGIACWLAGPRAIIPPVTAAAAFLVLWAMIRFQVFQQKHGTLFALGFVALCSALIPLIERGFVALDAAEKNKGVAQVPVAQTAESPLPPVAPIPQPVAPAAEAPSSDIPILTEEFEVAPADPSKKPAVRLKQDATVKIGRRTYRVMTGETFELVESKGGEVTFQANELRLRLPENSVEILGAKPQIDPETAKITLDAQREAVRRYPELGLTGSPENQLFVKTYQELKKAESPMLDQPDWPIRLAEFLAMTEKWRSVDDPPPGAKPAPAAARDADLPAEIPGGDELPPINSRTIPDLDSPLPTNSDLPGAQPANSDLPTDAPPPPQAPPQAP